MQLLLPAGTLHVWVIDLTGVNRIDPGWLPFLSEAESERAERYAFAPDRLRFQARRLLLRGLLAAYTDGEPAAIAYQTSASGKLSLGSHPLFFNLSHSQERVALAFLLGQPLGVDLEAVRPLPEWRRLAETWFSPDEQADLARLPAGIQLDAFFHIWTQKEAFLKARGEGLSGGLLGFSVPADPHSCWARLTIDPEAAGSWELASRELPGDYRAAVCARGLTQLAVEWRQGRVPDWLARAPVRDTPWPGI